MDSEEALEQFLAQYSGDNWVDYSDGYQDLLERCGDELLPTLLKCITQPQPDVRAAAVSLLATRRPHTPEVVEALAPLIHDPDPLVRIRVLECLKDFGDLALPLTDEIYAIVTKERFAKDQVPRILAMALLLHIDFEAWEKELFAELVIAATSQSGDLAEYLALRSVLEISGQQLPEEPDMPGEHRLDS